MLRLGRKPQNAEHVYRVRSNTIAATVWLVVSNVLAISLVVRASDYPLIFVLAVLYGIASNFLFIRLLLAAIFASSHGIRVANIFETFDLQWQDIERFEMGRWKIIPRTCLIHLRNGGIKHAAGVEESANFPKGDAEKMVEELNEQLARHRVEIGLDSRLSA